MTKKIRRKFMPQEKVAILKQHLLEDAMFDFSRTEESRPMRHGDAAWGWELS